MRSIRPRKVHLLWMAIVLGGCASFEPALRHQDLMRPRQPTARATQEGLEVSVVEFVTAAKSLQAFDADIAPYGVLALLIRVENNGAQSYQVPPHTIAAFLGDELLGSLSGVQAAKQAATSEYVAKALGWTILTGPFFIFAGPAAIAGSASHTAAVNRRIQQHFESLEYTGTILKPNQTAAGFLYFKLPAGAKNLERLVVNVEPLEEQSRKKLAYKFSLPSLELTSSVPTPVPARD